MRVAGAPRAISAAKYVVIYEAMEADESVPEGLRQKAAEAKQGCMATAAYQELGDLDPDYVAAELTQFGEGVVSGEFRLVEYPAPGSSRNFARRRSWKLKT